jgi:putative membrane protein
MKRNMMRFLMSALVLVFMSCGTKNGQEDSTEAAEDQNDEKFEDSKTDDDADFAVEAADGGMLEVQLGTLALTKASSPEVKQFAQMMVDDHSKANNELKAIAQQKNISLPTVLGDDHQKKYDNLNEKAGADFDKDYIDLMVKDHKDDIKEFEDEGNDGKDAEIKSWAAGKVATLRHHLEMAERTQDAVKNKKNQ